jgi:mRNA interferase RelE/StbE
MSKTKYRIVLHRTAVAEIKALPIKEKKRAKEVIGGLATEPIPVTATRIRGRRNTFRIRLSNYRILYEVHATEIVVYILGIAHHKEVYKRLLRRK